MCFPVRAATTAGAPSDIPQLVSHFVGLFARRVGKHINHIPKETLDAFTSYSWPGNVRELQT